MVDVGDKPETHRRAVAEGRITMAPTTLDLILAGSAKKGDVLGVARIAAMPAADARPFIAACERSCAASGQTAATCRPACLCTVDRLKRAQLWDRVLTDRLSADERARMSEIAEGCYDELR